MPQTLPSDINNNEESTHIVLTPHLIIYGLHYEFSLSQIFGMEKCGTVGQSYAG